MLSAFTLLPYQQYLKLLSLSSHDFLAWLLVWHISLDFLLLLEIPVLVYLTGSSFGCKGLHKLNSWVPSILHPYLFHCLLATKGSCKLVIFVVVVNLQPGVSFL